LSASDSAPLVDASAYQSLAGALQYVTLTRPDLAYVVQQVCLFMHGLSETHHVLCEGYLVLRSSDWH
jgi:hypothetical protein